MFYIYVLKSISFNTRYVGYTENIEKRFAEHNSGKCKYTSGRMPWEIIHTEEFMEKSNAMKREKFLKSGQGRKYLDNLFKIS